LVARKEIISVNNLNISNRNYILFPQVPPRIIGDKVLFLQHECYVPVCNSISKIDPAVLRRVDDRVKAVT